MIVARSFDPTSGQLAENTVEVAGPIAFTGGLGFGSFSVSSTGVIAYTAGTASVATTGISWLDRQGRPLGVLAAGTDLSSYNSYSVRLSPDGRWAVLSTFPSATADLELVDIARDVKSRFTFDGANELYPVWSSDGTEILFSSNRAGAYNLFRKSAAGSGDEHLFRKAASHQYATDWSRDGRTIVFTNLDPKTQSDIWMTPASGDGTATPVLATTFNEYAARVSPDGHWMAYTSDESGRPEVYVQRFPSLGDKSQISTQGGSEPQWRNDGRELFYLAADRTLNVVSCTTASIFTAGRPTRLFDAIVDTTLGSIHATHYAQTNDGQRFLVNMATASRAPTTVVLNWMAALRK